MIATFVTFLARTTTLSLTSVRSEPPERLRPSTLGWLKRPRLPGEIALWKHTCLGLKFCSRIAHVREMKQKPYEVNIKITFFNDVPASRLSHPTLPTRRSSLEKKSRVLATSRHSKMGKLTTRLTQNFKKLAMNRSYILTQRM